MKAAKTQLKTLQMKPICRAVIAACGAASVALSPLAIAQDKDSEIYEEVGMLEEVVVTATKRSQNMQDVPFAIAVLGDMQLEDLGITDMEDFTQMFANVNYVTLGPGAGSFYMRGISSAGENVLGSSPNVAVYLDEQPITLTNQFLNPHIYDIARIETLAGPQGTLFGANAQAGAIRLISNKPDPSQFSASYDL